MNDLGDLALWIALLLAVWGAALSFAGGALTRDAFVASGARGLQGAALFVAIASAALWWALLGSDFSLRYVATFTNLGLPVPWKLSAFWAGRPGTRLLYSLALSASATLAIRAGFDGGRVRRPWVVTILSAALAALLGTFVATLNPFDRLASLVEDGRGLDPRLQNATMAIEPALRALGYAASAVAATLALVVFVTRRIAGEWRRSLRAWLALGWCMLGASTLLALRSGYAEPGSGGFWLWTPPGVAGIGTSVDALPVIAVLAAIVVAAAVIGSGTRRYPLVAATILLAAGLAGALARTERVATLRDGESQRAKDPFGREWTFTSQGASRIERATHFATAVAVMAARGSARPRFVTTEVREFSDARDRAAFAPLTTLGLLSTTLEDVSVMLVTASEGRSTVRITFVPLAAWLWIGGVCVLIGGGLAIVSGTQPRERAG